MKKSDGELPAEDLLRRPSGADHAIRVACASAAVFGALNLAGNLVTDSMLTVDILALVTVIAGAVGVAEIRVGAYLSAVATGIYLLMAMVIIASILSGNAVSVSTPEWVRIDGLTVLFVATLWCGATFAALVVGLWMTSSARR